MLNYSLSLLIALSIGCFVFAQSDAYPKHIFQDIPFTPESIEEIKTILPTVDPSNPDLLEKNNIFYLRKYRKQITTNPIKIKVTDVDPFLGYALKWKENWDDIQIRFGHTEASFELPSGVTKEQLTWTDWIKLKEDPHFHSEDGTKTSSLGIQEVNDNAFFQLRFTGLSDGQLEKDQPKIFFSNPGPPKAVTASVTPSTENTDLCACPMPSFQNREQWCPDGSCPKDATPQPTYVTHLIIHHSAGTNSASDWAAVVRIIWDFHVNGNGWDDIGYNWLVDPNGVLYEGRGDNLQGAHFCGTNGNTMGVCVLGDFTDIEPTPVAIDRLTTLLAWKSCASNVNPLGAAYHQSSELVLNRISGHRDGCSTACPGDSFYPTLPGVREGVDQYIQDNCGMFSNTNSPTANHVKIAPNPVDQQLTVDLSNDYFGPVQIRLIEIASGSVLKSFSQYKNDKNFNFLINVQVLPAGIYALEIDCGKKVIEKVIKI